MNEKKANILSIFICPIFFVLLIFAIKGLEFFNDFSLVKYGVLPRDISGLKGIIFSPLIHSDFSHLTNNAVPIFVLLISLRYFYKSISTEIFIWSWFISGFLLWSFAKQNYHIGASGLIYALFSFLFFSGLIRKHTRLMAVSMFVVFLYGSLVWGIFPLQEKVSWEGHLTGAVSGVLLAFWFRHQGPPKQIYQYEIDEVEQELARENTTITYHYKKENDQN
jgi:membrane associated rhomboid family serine protease